jgi:hypothetical protein
MTVINIEEKRKMSKKAKVTLGNITSPSFMKVMESLLKEKVPLKTAFKIKTLTMKFNDELNKFHELRKDILTRYSDKDEAGKPILDERENVKLSDENMLAFQKDLTELLTIEFETDAIKIDELGDISLTASDLFTLGEIIDA